MFERRERFTPNRPSTTADAANPSIVVAMDGSEHPEKVQESTGGWRRTVESLRRRGELWEPFATRTADEILDWQNVQEELVALKGLGLMNAWELVLRGGPRACRQARRKVERFGPAVRDAGSLVASLVVKAAKRGRRTAGDEDVATPPA